LRDKNMFGSYVYFTRQKPETFVPVEVFISKLTGGRAKTSEEFMALVTSPGFDSSTLKGVDIEGSDPWKHPPLDISDVPKFQLNYLSFGDELGKIALKLTAMIIVCIGLFYLSFVSFIRYDVR
ncbi:hypothetical protein LLG96_17190, partial [bacterium]|nr:hypothetical protein [bacterium]